MFLQESGEMPALDSFRCRQPLPFRSRQAARACGPSVHHPWRGSRTCSRARCMPQ